jgi:hypothetical protein
MKSRRWRAWPKSSCTMPRAQRLSNVVAATFSVLAAAWLLAGEAPLHDAVHVAAPAAAFASALAGSTARGSAWMAHLAMVLNVAAVVVLAAFALSAALEGEGAMWLAAFQATGALLAGWNIACLSSPALDA